MGRNSTKTDGTTKRKGIAPSQQVSSRQVAKRLRVGDNATPLPMKTRGKQSRNENVSGEQATQDSNTE